MVTITHAPTAPTAVVGTGLGTVRTYFVPTAVSGRKAPDDRLHERHPHHHRHRSHRRPGGARCQPRLRGRLRAEPAGHGGLSLYNTDLSTIAAGSRTVRPIIGGSGIYSGARGTAVSTNLGDQGFRHVFRFTR